MARGGRRPGAGAPKGNLNALRSGRYTTDINLQAILARLSIEDRTALAPYLRSANRTIKRRLAVLAAAQDQKAGPAVLPFRHPSTTTTTHAEQSNAGLGLLALRLTAFGFFGADAFTRRHSPAAPVIEQALDHIDEQLDAGLGAAIKNPAALLRSLIHDEISDWDGAVQRCPYCPWTDRGRKERTS